MHAQLHAEMEDIRAKLLAAKVQRWLALSMRDVAATCGTDGLDAVHRQRLVDAVKAGIWTNLSSS